MVLQAVFISQRKPSARPRDRKATWRMSQSTLQLRDSSLRSTSCGMHAPAVTNTKWSLRQGLALSPELSRYVTQGRDGRRDRSALRRPNRDLAETLEHAGPHRQRGDR